MGRFRTKVKLEAGDACISADFLVRCIPKASAPQKRFPAMSISVTSQHYSETSEKQVEPADTKRADELITFAFGGVQIDNHGSTATNCLGGHPQAFNNALLRSLAIVDVWKAFVNHRPHSALREALIIHPLSGVVESHGHLPGLLAATSSSKSASACVKIL